MIAYILAAVGGYLIGDSMKDSQKFAEGGTFRDEVVEVEYYDDKEEKKSIILNTNGIMKAILYKQYTILK